MSNTMAKSKFDVSPFITLFDQISHKIRNIAFLTNFEINKNYVMK